MFSLLMHKHACVYIYIYIVHLIEYVLRNRKNVCVYVCMREKNGKFAQVIITVYTHGHMLIR